MTKIAEQKIMSKLDRIENILIHILPKVGEDNWTNDPKVVAKLEKRAEEAEEDYKLGKLQSAEEVFSQLKNERAKCTR